MAHDTGEITQFSAGYRTLIRPPGWEFPGPTGIERPKPTGVVPVGLGSTGRSRVPDYQAFTGAVVVFAGRLVAECVLVHPAAQLFVEVPPLYALSEAATPVSA